MTVGTVTLDLASSQDITWHGLTIEETLDQLETSVTVGLSLDEASARLVTYGPNELKEAPRPTFWARLLDQFRNFLIIILIVASVISLLLGDYVEAAAIMAIVILNAVLGVIQESRAEEALAALRKMTAPESRVMRAGHQITIPARELVPGDVVLLEAGNYIPADVRLIESANLRVEEASLTGESVPVQKNADLILEEEIPLGDRKNMAYSGTVAAYGRGRGAVVSTGMRTQIGLIAEMIQSFETEPTPLQRKLEKLGHTLGIAALAVCGIVFLVGIVRYMANPVPGLSLTEAILELFIVAVSLAIAAVPEGLPAIVTICLALGMQRMVARHALLRRLPAVEALGSATAICSDKTGTLTQNAMTVTHIWADETLLSITGDGYTPEGIFQDGDEEVDVADIPGVNILLRGALLCNDATLELVDGDAGRALWRMVGDPTEGALVVAAAKAGYWRPEVEQDFPRVSEIPFDSVRKRMSTVHEMRHSAYAGESDPMQQTFPQDLEYLVFVKGAPDVLLDLCNRIYRRGRIEPLSDMDREHILEMNAALASNALRVLAVAAKGLDRLPQMETPEDADLSADGLTPQTLERDLVLVGLAGMIDPARPEVKPAIATARRAGIKTVMITGDYPNTAVAIAREINLLRPGGRVLTGQELDELDESQFQGVVEDVDVYARVSPQHKVRIVEALRARGHIAAMTGDGVNDAPALKRADIGVAMGITGTDVTKETAAMVLTDDNYASIVSAVEEGRIIYSNIRKFVFYLLSCNVAEILIIFLATLLGWPLPLTAIQLLVLNLLTDGAPALALGLEAGEPDIMNRPPRDPKEPVIDREMLIGTIIQAVAKTVAVLAVFRLSLAREPDNLILAQTMAFLTLSFSELFRAYGVRSEHYFIWQIGVFSNKYMQWAVLSSVVILLAITYIPVLGGIFDTTPVSRQDWLLMLPFMLVPFIIGEITKVFLRPAQPQQAHYA
jgi:Ca2+-transporting ATPase